MVRIAKGRIGKNIGFYKHFFLVTIAIVCFLVTIVMVKNIAFYKHFFLVTSIIFRIVKNIGLYREVFQVTNGFLYL